MTPADVAANLRARLEAGDDEDGPALDLFLTASDGGADLARAAISSGWVDAMTGAKPAGNWQSDYELAMQASMVGAGIPSGAVVRRRGVNAQMLEQMEQESGSDPQALAPLRAVLAEFAGRRPDDFSIQSAAALLAFAADDPDGAAEPVAALAGLARSAESPPAEAVGAWALVGAAAVKHDVTRADGAALSAAALAAADALEDPAWRIALRVEAGRAAAAAGDPAAAERNWRKLLGDVLDREIPPAEPRPAGAEPAPPGDAGASAEPRFPPPPGVRALLAASVLAFADAADATPAGTIPVTTGPRARRALQLAKMAADAGLTELSLRAVREALGGGAPLGGGGAGGGMFGGPPAGGMLPVLPTLATGVVTMRNAGPGVMSDREIAVALQELTGRWGEAGADPAAVADVLLDAVLPPGRPHEAFAYAGAIDVNAQDSSPVDAVRPLLEWLQRADRTDDLAARLATRAAGTPGRAPAVLIAARSAVRRGDAETAAANLKELTDAARGGDPAATALLLYAAVPALNAGVAPDAALEALRLGVEGEPGGEANPANYPRLIREVLARRDVDGGVALVDRYLDATRRQAAQYGGSFGVRSERTALTAAIGALARGGAIAAALDRLDELDRLPDAGRSYANQSHGPTAGFAADVARESMRLSADERFDLLLNWTVPGGNAAGEDRGEVRALTGELPPDVPPAEFGLPADPARALAAAADRPPPPLTGTPVALAAAAVEAGRAAELAVALDAAAAARAAAPAYDAVGAQNAAPAGVGNDYEAMMRAAMPGGAAGTAGSPFADPGPLSAVTDATLRTLANQPADVPAALAAAESLRAFAASRGPAAGEPGRAAVAANLLLAWALLGDAETRPAAAGLLTAIEDWASNAGRSAGEPFRAEILALRTEADALAAAPDAPPNGADHGVWRSAALGSYSTAPPTRPPWVLLHGAAHATGAAKTNLLVFRYPLAGDVRRPGRRQRRQAGRGVPGLRRADLRGLRLQRHAAAAGFLRHEIRRAERPLAPRRAGPAISVRRDPGPHRPADRRPQSVRRSAAGGRLAVPGPRRDGRPAGVVPVGPDHRRTDDPAGGEPAGRRPSGRVVRPAGLGRREPPGTGPPAVRRGEPGASVAAVGRNGRRAADRRGPASEPARPPPPAV